MNNIIRLKILLLFLFVPTAQAATCSEYVVDFYNSKMKGELEVEYAQEITELAQYVSCPELYIALLKNEYSGIERFVFQELGNIKTKQSRNALLNVWENECLEYGTKNYVHNEHICPIIAVSLYKNGITEHLKKVFKIARTQQTAIRINIASALGHLNTSESKDILYMFLQEDNKGVTRCFAAKSLLKLGETRVLEIMNDQLGTPMDTLCHEDILLEHGIIEEQYYDKATCEPAISNNP